MAYPSDLTDEQWALLEPVLRRPGKRGRRHGPDLRRVVDGMLYVAQTGCQWRYLPGEFGPWTRVWGAISATRANRRESRRVRREMIEGSEAAFALVPDGYSGGGGPIAPTPMARLINIGKGAATNVEVIETHTGEAPRDGLFPRRVGSGEHVCFPSRRPRRPGHSTGDGLGGWVPGPYVEGAHVLVTWADGTGRHEAHLDFPNP